jgi:hypothetical protein
MSGVFLSYSRGDRELADQIIRGLRAVGVEVWWDEDMRGVDWQEELERRISNLAGVALLWTPNSVSSKHVKDEARLALENDKLVNIVAGVSRPPFPYDRVNGLPLDGWNGRQPHRGWTRLVETVEEKIVEAGGAKPGEITGALARRDQHLRDRQDAFESAQKAFSDAQGVEGESDKTAEAATVALARAREDLGRAGEMRLAPAILRAAQLEFDTARVAEEEADRANRLAKVQLTETSRELSRRKAELDELFSIATRVPERPPESIYSAHTEIEDSAATPADTPASAPPPETSEGALAPNDIPLPSHKDASEVAPPELAQGKDQSVPLVHRTTRFWLSVTAIAAVILFGAIAFSRLGPSRPGWTESSEPAPIQANSRSSAVVAQSSDAARREAVPPVSSAGGTSAEATSEAADDSAFALAKSVGSTAAYKAYLSQYPNGRHSGAAEAHLGSSDRRVAPSTPELRRSRVLRRHQSRHPQVPGGLTAPMAAPSAAFVAPPTIPRGLACPYGYHLGPQRRRCWPN